MVLVKSPVCCYSNSYYGVAGSGHLVLCKISWSPYRTGHGLVKSPGVAIVTVAIVAVSIVTGAREKLVVVIVVAVHS